MSGIYGLDAGVVNRGGRLGGGQHTLGNEEHPRAAEDGTFIVGYGFEQSLPVQLADELRGGMVAHALGLDGRSGVVVAVGVHRALRAEASTVRDVVTVAASGQHGVRRRFHCPDSGRMLIGQEGQAETA